jgi:hypothetical protein
VGLAHDLDALAEIGSAGWKRVHRFIPFAAAETRARCAPA